MLFRAFLRRRFVVCESIPCGAFTASLYVPLPETRILLVAYDSMGRLLWTADPSMAEADPMTRIFHADNTAGTAAVLKVFCLSEASIPQQEAITFPASATT